MTTANPLGQNRESFEPREWEAAYAALTAADRERPLEPDDIDRLAIAAFLLGREGESADLWLRAHHEFLRRGDTPRAVRCAVWLSLPLIVRGETAQGGGWIARGTRLLDEFGRDCVERGYLVYAGALRSIFEGDPSTARTGFEAALVIGARFHDPDLLTLGRLGQGRALIRLDQIGPGTALLDEAMTGIAAGEVSPIVVGITYCSMIDACQETFDLRRAQEWTTALTRWCDRQPDIARFGGQCLVHRAELMQVHGAWPGATQEAERARDRLSRPPVDRAVGTALYQLAELHRLRGEFEEAEEHYRDAGEAGRDPQPGWALLRLAQGKLDGARTAISRAMDEARSRQQRLRMLPACLEIALAANDVPGARAAAEELARIATSVDAPFVRAVAAHASGAVQLAEHDASAALNSLRAAERIWRDLDAPYDNARTRLLIGLACRALGDADSADLEVDAARKSFQQLGARPDLARLEALSRDEKGKGADRLTSRELEVLLLVAAGRTNRAISTELGISEKTVARHVSNIFTKLGVSSRAAATAHAYQHGLVKAR
ncbi:MAG: LuxR C-terminal-related transcriptional regulator [Gemmatimonadota bacterium]